MANYEIADGDDWNFDSRKLCVAKGEVEVEGKVYRRQYQLKEGAQTASDLQIIRNYANAVRSAGGQVLLEGNPPMNCLVDVCGKVVTGKLNQGNSETWISVMPCNEGGDYTVWVIEKQAMVQEVTASAMLSALQQAGHVALYLNFDTGKATIRTESTGTVTQIVQLLRSNPALKIGIEGHTDNVGDSQSNMKLSELRARAVVAALTAAGIEPARLSAAGFGATHPIADNDSEAGRAKNRRVELVRR